ncbi:MAG: pantetheine-phosphate adenylyltransferase [Clostridium sp.]|nr:pantetheine-phosphate adenylyltransferase [Clostridium sp.]
MRTAVFAGTFDPFTIGHAHIVKRGLEIFDRIAIMIGVNAQKPDAAAKAAERFEHISALFASEPRVTVHLWSGLTADFAKSIGAKFHLRGIRSAKDYEYELGMADANATFGLETVTLFTSPSLSYVSSSLVRELASFGKDVSEYLPTKEYIDKLLKL